MYEEFKQFFLDAMRDGSKNEIVRKWYASLRKEREPFVLQPVFTPAFALLLIVFRGIQFAQGLTQKQISELFQVRLRTGDLWVARGELRKKKNFLPLLTFA